MTTIKDIFDYVSHISCHCVWYKVSCIEDCPYNDACNIPAVLTACDMILSSGEYH